MSAQLIINADDFGLSESVNEAIIDVFRAGNLSSATLMVNMPGTQHAVGLAQSHPKLGIGLHFCITEGKSLTQPASLLNADGTFISRSELVKRILKRKVDTSEVRQEFEAQLDRQEAFGLNFTHSDSHQHTMMLPWVFKAVKPVLDDRKLPMRIVRPPQEAFGGKFKKPVKMAKQALHQSFANHIRKRFEGTTNDYLVSIHDLDGLEGKNESIYEELLRPFKGESVVELMVHPYKIDETLRLQYGADVDLKEPFFQKCEWEYRMLSSRPLFEEFTLCNFRDIH